MGQARPGAFGRGGQAKRERERESGREKTERKEQDGRERARDIYRGTSLIRNSPPLQDHHRTLGIVLL